MNMRKKAAVSFVCCCCSILFLYGCSSVKAPEFTIKYGLQYDLLKADNCSYVLYIESGSIDFHEIEHVEIIVEEELKDRFISDTVEELSDEGDHLAVKGIITFDNEDLAPEQIDKLIFFRDLRITLNNGKKITVKVPGLQKAAAKG